MPEVIAPTTFARPACVIRPSGNFRVGGIAAARESRTPNTERCLGKAYSYWRCCVDFSRRDVPHLRAMIAEARDIAYATFFRRCDWRETCELLGYDLHYRQGLVLKSDWHVAYYRSKYRGQRCYFLQHSAIEYIFVGTEFKETGIA